MGCGCLELMSNNVLLSAGFAWLVAQGIKLIIDIKNKKPYSWSWIFDSGGFPSSHTSTVVAMTAAIYLDNGVSNLFVLSMILMFIVIQDSYKVRYQVGQHAKLLNKLKKSKLLESIGHTPKQIIGGVVVGLVVSIIIYLL